MDEALCDAGAIAMSKDTGPREGYGDVIGKPWRQTKGNLLFWGMTSSTGTGPEKK
jgi:hypothetical protein